MQALACQKFKGEELRKKNNGKESERLWRIDKQICKRIEIIMWTVTVARLPDPFSTKDPPFKSHPSILPLYLLLVYSEEKHTENETGK